MSPWPTTILLLAGIISVAASFPQKQPHLQDRYWILGLSLLFVSAVTGTVGLWVGA